MTCLPYFLGFLPCTVTHHAWTCSLFYSGLCWLTAYTPYQATSNSSRHALAVAAPVAFVCCSLYLFIVRARYGVHLSARQTAVPTTFAVPLLILSLSLLLPLPFNLNSRIFITWQTLQRAPGLADRAWWFNRMVEDDKTAALKGRNGVLLMAGVDGLLYPNDVS